MSYKGLKGYQRSALSVFAEWVGEIGRWREDCVRRVSALESQGAMVRPSDRDFPGMAWAALAEAGKLPRVSGGGGPLGSQLHVSRTDARKEPIPHVCLKVPTGGGKTLLGAAMVETLAPETGVVLWITPSRAIFRQTWGVLSDRTHNCRQRLDRACGGRVKLMRKEEVFSALAVESQLCVMPVMLQAAGDSRGDFLKMFRDSSNTPRFFPEMDDIPANNHLLKAHPDLDKYDLGDGVGVGSGAVKHSLFNALKLCRPLIVLDEAHRGYTEKQRRKLCELNPRMILELSATPSPERSNILVDVPGAALREEEMIKLPLNVHHLSDSTWRATLTRAKEELDALEETARKLRGEDGSGRYVRPMMLVRVERVGKKQRDGVRVHAEDVREFLLRLPASRADLVIRPEQVRVRTSEKDEISGEDLLSPSCPVRCIVTKDALREGWDCPFAYILTLLDSTTAAGALTQMTGRILRQPDAKKTGTRLDESHVFCFNRGVGVTVAQIKKGLESEGMSDLKHWVRGGAGDSAGVAAPSKRIRTIPRRDEFAERRVFLPVVLHKVGRKFRPLDYEADILRYVDWRGLSKTDLGLTLQSVDKVVETIVQVGPSGREGGRETLEADAGEGLSLLFFAGYLRDVIPNPWLAADTATRVLDSLRESAGGDRGLLARRFRIAEAIKRKVTALVDREAKRVFCEKLKRGDIRLRLLAGHDHEFPAESTVLTGEGESVLLNEDGEPLRKSFYGKVYAGAFNTLERAAAVHMDGHEAVNWWHRFAAGGEDYALQGWRRKLVYPDFAVCVGEGENARILILETKGEHLSGNEDTEYKRELLEKKLSAENPRALECGDVTLKTGGREVRMVLRLLLAEGWREEFDKLAAGE